MNTIHYRPGSMGAQLWGGQSAHPVPIAIPSEIARAAARPALEDASHPLIAAAVVAAVVGLAFLAYTFV